MNRIYRLVWCRSRRVVVVASELASTHRGGCSGNAGKVDRRTRGLAPRLLLVALAGAGGMAFTSAACAQSSGDPKLDDLQSLIAKYDTHHASAAPVEAAAATSVAAVGGSNGTAADSSLLPSIAKRSAPVRHERLMAAKSSTAGTNGSKALANASMAETPTDLISQALSKKVSRAPEAIASTGPGEVRTRYSAVADVADRQRMRTTVATSAQQSSSAKDDLGPQEAGHASLAVAEPPAARHASTDTALQGQGNAAIEAPAHPREMNAEFSAPSTSPRAMAVSHASLAQADATDKQNPASVVRDASSENTVDTARPRSPKTPVAIVDAGAMDKTRAADTSTVRAVAAANTATAAVPQVFPAGNRLADVSTTADMSAKTPLASSAADRRVEHATKAKAASSAAIAGLAAEDTDNADNAFVAAGANESTSAFAPFSPMSAQASGSLMQSLSLSTGLSGSVTATVPVFPTPSNSPTGLIVGNGGAVGTTTQLLGSSTNSLFAGGNGYVTNGSLQVNNANFSQGYSVVSVLGIPTLTLNPVGTLLTSTSGAVVGGTGFNSHLTLLGGVTSDSYIYNINNGNQSGLLGIALPNQAPAFASTCLNAALASVACYGINAAQDYQVLVGDGAKANGSKEVVIGTNASHTLPLVNANVAFPGSGPNDPNNPSGVPTADYEARLGHSVVIGDDASGTANSQVILGAEATANVANSVALGYQSIANRGAQTNYTAYGLSARQNSAGEVSIGSPGQERQITNVAAGSAATDAVNVAQLQGVAADAADSVQYDNTGKTSITLGGTSSTDGGATNGTTITNLHQGALSATSTDAVNGAQLYATNNTVNNIYATTSKFFQANSSGSASSAAGTDSLAAGPGAVSNANASIAMGSGATTAAGSDNAMAIGTGANATFANSIALGSGSATTVGALTGYMAYGLNTPQNSAGELNIGNRQITGLAPGKADTDAVNVAQLEGVSADAANSIQYDSPARTSVTLAGLISTDGGMTNGTTLTNLHQGMVSAMSTDAVNGSQLWHWTQDTTNQYSNYSLYNQINNNAGARYYDVQSVLPGSTATGVNAAAAGPNALAEGANSFAMGNSATAQGDYSLAISDNTQAMGAGSIALGSGATATFANSIALGAGSMTMVGAQLNYIAYGLSAPQTSAGELNIGNRQITGVAAGSSPDDAVNLAQLKAVASRVGGSASNNGFAVDYDTDATGNPTNMVTLTGDGSGKPVTITNLAAGAETASSTDAVNGGQLYHWTQDSSNSYSNMSLYNDIQALSQGGAPSGKYMQVSSAAGGATASGSNSVAEGPTASAGGANSVAIGSGASAAADNSVALGAGSVATRADTVSVGGVGSERQITNVAAGTADTDAANVGQVNAGVQQAENWAAGYTDQRFGALSSQIQQVGHRANAGVAAAMAMAGLPQAYEPGRSMAAVAAGTFRSESSIAVGVSTISEGGRWVYKLTGSVDTRGDGGISIGAGMQW